MAMREGLVQEDIQKILDVAIHAPSGSNSQPWKFIVRGSTISIIAIPEKDHPILNYRNRGTWVAHGALIENIIIAASSYGYEALVGNYFSDGNNQNLVTNISLEKKNIAPDTLYPFIQKRTTNRKRYAQTVLTPEQKDALIKEAARGGSEEVIIIEDPDERKEVAKALAMNEIVMLENRPLHKLFFDEIVWTDSEEKEKKSGLYLKTMELALPQEKALNLFRFWPLMRLANALGISKKIAEENSGVYATGAAMIILPVADKDKSFITAGRMMQRIWLQTHRMDMHGQLITGIFFLHQNLESPASLLSLTHRELMRTAYDTISRIVRIPNGKIVALLLRIGKSDQPSAFSSRKAADITWA
ncbi:MAG: nitroreductase family protein [bacterium]|nr:nitroreductase family protein [bacterium]MDZ4285765.1 nitroreductase family protein [Candidatus Sungbacteria bacterium]